MNEKALAELSPADRLYMEDLLAKEAGALEPAQREHLVARREYLTQETQDRYAINGPETLSGTNIDEYDIMKVADLKAMCDTRGIVLDPTVTKKADIIAVLRADDNGELEDEDEEEVTE